MNGGNYSTTILLNASANDLITLVNSVYFNITNRTEVGINFSKASQNGIYWSLMASVASFPEGVYNIKVEKKGYITTYFIGISVKPNEERKVFATLNRSMWSLRELTGFPTGYLNTRKIASF